ncbi:MAG: hypothetical protein KF744_03050 [Taibaiella sp.]|nr:hypothetical protein [Taibaiella sp.]
MSEKFKKAGRSYVLSDSSINEYGFRLLTSGYQIESFRKNPIGYYMHRREDGIVLKWEDLHIDDDKLIGTPVINLSHPRGEQTLDEAENGFLNAASVGHIVVLEYSTEKEQMLPGQTGPTITKWYNKECSLVDIPGNCNALTRLYDVNENELNLADFSSESAPIIYPLFYDRLCAALSLEGKPDEHTLLLSITNLDRERNRLTTENQLLRENHQLLATQLAEVTASHSQQEIERLLNRALEDRKITVELKGRLANDYAGNAASLKTLLAAMPAYRSITEQINKKAESDGEAQWEWDDYENNDPAGNKLKALRANDPIRYKELFDKKFAD